ncbi:MAG: hypothetical protein WCF04_03250 [Candidatus Nanopelagicales bacterium]
MRLRALIAALFAAVLLVAGAMPAGAVTGGTQFPRASWVKAVMKGKGAWDRTVVSGSTWDSAEYGVSPARCDLGAYLGGYSSAREAWYDGGLKGSRTVWGEAQVTVLRYPSTSAAASALTQVGSYANDCAQAEEWVCSYCDGGWTAYRTAAAPRRVGEQSVAWRERRVGMGVESARVIATRAGATVVLVDVARSGDPATMRTPKYPTWKKADKIARKALATAT